MMLRRVYTIYATVREGGYWHPFETSMPVVEMVHMMDEWKKKRPDAPPRVPLRVWEKAGSLGFVEMRVLAHSVCFANGRILDATLSAFKQDQ